MVNRRFDLWLPSYAAGTFGRAAARRRRRQGLTHILYLVCDHYEPRHGATRPGQPEERVAAWHTQYARMQETIHAQFGTRPLHTFFYPPHHGYEHLPKLAEMAHDGLGEVELHYHHHGDTEQTLRRDLRATLDAYHAQGLLLQSGEKPKGGFGFVHGDWALNNSCHDKYCGVNDEISLLQELGCWADFTMPSGNVCQTRKINSIYYGVSDPHRPKAHDSGPDAKAGTAAPGGLMMIQGPLAINWGAPSHPRPENASLTTNNWGRPDRVRTWLDANIHVQGRPDWLFVKLHTHGAIERDFDALFGDKALALHRHLNEHYNDGKRYRLHYVTARQAYNIAKAAEAGFDGDPSRFLDHVVAPPATQFYHLGAAHRLLHCTPKRLALDSVEGGTRLRSRVGPVREIHGPLAEIDIDTAASRIVLRANAQGGEFTLHLTPGAAEPRIDGSPLAQPAGPSGPRVLKLAPNGQCHLSLDTVAQAA
jgi:hypothetical protein